jgi:hypothetical protein
LAGTGERNTLQEEPFLTRFVKAPDAHAFLANLPYDATPTTDDRPFFFFNLRRGEMFSVLSHLDSLDLNNLGIGILVFLLILSTILTVLFVVLPLLFFDRKAMLGERRQKLQVLGYFLCLGLGFIMVEIGFMQTFVLFLGHPIYALAVILASLLAASGLGSALSERGSARFGIRGFVRRVVVALAIVLGIYAFSLTHVFHLLLGIPLAARIAIAVVLVFIPGLLMGALLPSGVRTANSLGQGIVAWGWGLNGAASVVGSILAVALSLNFGFTLALLCGIAVYLVSMVLLPDRGRLAVGD